MRSENASDASGLRCWGEWNLRMCLFLAGVFFSLLTVPILEVWDFLDATKRVCAPTRVPFFFLKAGTVTGMVVWLEALRTKLSGTRDLVLVGATGMILGGGTGSAMVGSSLSVVMKILVGMI
jgi:hypothetical protein